MAFHLPANVGDVRDVGSIPEFEDPLEKGMATHSSILAMDRGTEKPGRLWFKVLQGARHD